MLHKTKLNNNNNLAQVITFSIFKKNNSNVWNHLCSIKILDIYNNKKKNFTILFLFNLLNKNNNLAQVIRFSIFKKNNSNVGNHQCYLKILDIYVCSV